MDAPLQLVGLPSPEGPGPTTAAGAAAPTGFGALLAAQLAAPDAAAAQPAASAGVAPTKPDEAPAGIRRPSATALAPAPIAPGSPSVASIASSALDPIEPPLAQAFDPSDPPTAEPDSLPPGRSGAQVIRTRGAPLPCSLDPRRDAPASAVEIRPSMGAAAERGASGAERDAERARDEEIPGPTIAWAPLAPSAHAIAPWEPLGTPAGGGAGLERFAGHRFGTRPESAVGRTEPALPNERELLEASNEVTADAPRAPTARPEEERAGDLARVARRGAPVAQSDSPSDGRPPAAEPPRAGGAFSVPRVAAPPPVNAPSALAAPTPIAPSPLAASTPLAAPSPLAAPTPLAPSPLTAATPSAPTAPLPSARGAHAPTSARAAAIGSAGARPAARDASPRADAPGTPTPTLGRDAAAGSTGLDGAESSPAPRFQLRGDADDRAASASGAKEPAPTRPPLTPEGSAPLEPVAPRDGAARAEAPDASRPPSAPDNAVAARADAPWDGGATANTALGGPTAHPAARPDALGGTSSRGRADVDVTRETDSETRARRQEAAVDAVSRMTLKRHAVGEVELPELGRVRVAAHLDRGVVDVNVVAQRPETAALLGAQSHDIAKELRHHAVPLGNLEVGRSLTDGRAGSGGSSGSDGHGRGGDSSTPAAAADDAGSARGPATSGTRGRRVRIVL